MSKKETAMIPREENLPAIPSEFSGVGIPEQLEKEDEIGKKRWLCINVKKHPVSGEPSRMDHLYDTGNETFAEKVDCVILAFGYSRRLFYFDGQKNVTLCSSMDMLHGLAQSDFIWTPKQHERQPLQGQRWSEIIACEGETFRSNLTRDCTRCIMQAEAMAGTTRLRGPCIKERNFLCFDLSNGQFFLHRCRKTSAQTATDFITKYLTISRQVGQKGSVPKFKKDIISPFYYRVTLRGEMDKSGNFARSIFEVTGGTAPHMKDGKLMWQPAWGEDDMREWAELSKSATGLLSAAAREEAEIVGGEGETAPHDDKDKPF